MKLLSVPLETSPVFHQNEQRDALKRVVGAENFDDFSFIPISNEVGCAKMNDKLVEKVEEFKPDIMYMQLQETDLISLNTIKLIKYMMPNIYIINWCGDYRPYVLDRFLEIGKVIDLSLLSNKGQLEWYRSMGIKRIEYMQIGGCVEVYYPLPDIKKEKKVLFCGNKSRVFVDSKKRDELIWRMHDNFPCEFFVYGGQWDGIVNQYHFKSPGLRVKQPVYHEEYNKLMNSVLMTVGINAINNLDHYFSERQIMSMASGTLHIGHYVPGLETYFENGKHCVWFNTVDECIELCKYYMEHPDDANKIGLEGAKIIAQEHTWDCRFKELLNIL